LRRELASQIVSPVQWTRSIEWLAAQGVTLFVEIGAGQALSGLVKRIAREAATLSISSAADAMSAAPRIAEALRS
ncbi:MAG TPA: hypothetical protein VID72_06145, partial [Ktedonobacterales bacterium]